MRLLPESQQPNGVDAGSLARKEYGGRLGAGVRSVGAVVWRDADPESPMQCHTTPTYLLLEKVSHGSCLCRSHIRPPSES